MSSASGCPHHNLPSLTLSALGQLRPFLRVLAFPHDEPTDISFLRSHHYLLSVDSTAFLLSVLRICWANLSYSPCRNRIWHSVLLQPEFQPHRLRHLRGSSPLDLYGRRKARVTIRLLFWKAKNFHPPSLCCAARCRRPVSLWNQDLWHPHHQNHHLSSPDRWGGNLCIFHGFLKIS